VKEVKIRMEVNRNEDNSEERKQRIVVGKLIEGPKKYRRSELWKLGD